MGIGGLILIGVVVRDGHIACSLNGVVRDRGGVDVAGDVARHAGVACRCRSW